MDNIHLGNWKQWQQATTAPPLPRRDWRQAKSCVCVCNWTGKCIALWGGVTVGEYFCGWFIMSGGLLPERFQHTGRWESWVKLQLLYHQTSSSLAQSFSRNCCFFFFALVLSQWPCLLCGCAHAGCVSGKKQCVVILLQLTTWSTNMWNETLDYLQSPSTLYHSFSCTLGRGWVVLEPIPAGLRWRRGYALVKSVVYHRIASEDAQPSITPVNNLELPSVDHLFVFVSWEETGKLGRNLCKQRENTQTPL